MASVFGWQNYVKDVVPFVLSAASNMGPGNLQGDQGSPSTGWQTQTGTISGSNTLLQIKGTSPLSTVPWGAVGVFRANLTSAASITFNFYIGASVQYSATVSGPAAGYGQVFVVPPTTVMAEQVNITFNDPGNPDNFINVPLAFGGPVWTPIGNISFASTVGRDDSTDEVISRGGQEWPVNRWQRRRWNIAMDAIRQSEVWASVAELDRVARVGGNVFCLPNTLSSNTAQEAIYGRLKAGADISFPYSAGDRRGWRATITERI